MKNSWLTDTSREKKKRVSAGVWWGDEEVAAAAAAGTCTASLSKMITHEIRKL